MKRTVCSVAEIDRNGARFMKRLGQLTGHNWGDKRAFVSFVPSGTKFFSCAGYANKRTIGAQTRTTKSLHNPMNG